MKRRPIIAGNWKMNTTLNSATTLVNELAQAINKKHVQAEIVICPPFPFLLPCQTASANSVIKLGAQDIHFEKNGAYTGDISAEMLASIPCQYVIIGHSERRKYHHETNAIINKKIKASLGSRIQIIFCIGESNTERETGETFNVLSTQLIEGLKGLESQVLPTTLSIAYEPIWAIGTGKVATPTQAQETHEFIRTTLSNITSTEVADKIRILYGGSVKPDNAKELLSQPDIDGALVGGASLSVAQLLPIIESI